MAKFKSVISNFEKIKAAVSEKEQKGGESSYDNSLLFKPKFVQGQDVTKFRIRFLPIEESVSGKPWMKVSYHMFERPGDNKFIKVIDPRSVDSKATNPISAYATKLWKSDNEIDKTMAKKLFSKDRYFTLVYVKTAPENQQQYVGKVLIYEIGQKLYEKLFITINEFEKCFWDPYKGQDFLLVVKETGDQNKKWPDYSSSDWMGEAGQIVEDEKLMEKIADQAEKISIKAEIIEKSGIKTAAELNDLLFGGMEQLEGQQRQPSKPATELVSEVVATKKKAAPDFGTETANPIQKVVSKPTPVVESVKSEVEVNVDDINLDDIGSMLNDDDFK
jgi:hypothetical protein